MEIGERGKNQEERIEKLRSKLDKNNYEFIRKELMLNLNLDLNGLVEPAVFQRYYAFRDSEKDDMLNRIRSAENYYQAAGVISAIPFVYLSVKQKDIKYFLPGLILIGGLKYYSGKVR